MGYGTSSTSYSVGSAYQAATDGILSVYSTNCGNGQDICILSDNSSNPSTAIFPCGGNSSGITIPYYKTAGIKKGNYWKVTSNCAQAGNTNGITWLPSGS